MTATHRNIGPFSQLDVTEVLNYVCLNDDFFNFCIFIS